jgi:serine/threonine protein phosphatase PrpC
LLALRRFARVLVFNARTNLSNNLQFVSLRFLAVARAIGDKHYNTGGDLVTAVPDVTEECLRRYAKQTERTQFLLLACDGLWDVFSSEEASAFTETHLVAAAEARAAAAAADGDDDMFGDDNGGGDVDDDDLQSVSDALAKAALARGSTDNVSVVIVRITNNSD